MGTSPFAEALGAVLAPLRFAARDEFAGLDRVRDLEGAVRRAAERAASLAVPPDARERLERVGRAFAELAEGVDRAGARDEPGPRRAQGPGPRHPPVPGTSRAPAGAAEERARRARRRAVEGALAELAPLAEPGFAAEALGRPLTVLSGVGPRRAETLARRGLRCVADLLFHLPVRYDDRRDLASIKDLQVGRRATFAARVLGTERGPVRRRRGGRPGPAGGRSLRAVVGDETGAVNLVWFRGADALAPVLREGARLLVTGDVRRYRFSLELLHPEVELLEGPGEVGLADRPRVVPDYATPEGLHPRALRRLVQRAVADYTDLVEGHLPAALVRERGLPGAAEALRTLHAPPGDADPAALGARGSPAHVRLILEELYLLELGLALRRAHAAAQPGIAIAADGPRARAAPEALPFALTRAQRRAWQEIRADLARPHPMSRLLQGDVGSGKTAVAFLAAVAVAETGHQTALMAPTELLAEQHARTLRRLAAAGGDTTALRIELLTASRPRAEAEAVREALARGEIDLVVGTHALVQGDVGFRSLGLCVVDEQHRFGVLQRAALAAKSGTERAPDVVVMTATPIPRTLALTLYGDLDLTVIDELPPGRAPVATEVLRPGEGRRVVEAIRAAAGRGEQVYVVYPLVEESEKVDLRAAEASAERIARAFPDLRVDLVHGRLAAADRAEAMDRFERGETHVLVCTSVIEVGVDVPNATLMVVEHAERFGLAQLHQLRGRVGRGKRPGACLLVARGGGEESEARLAAMLETTDGFCIADADLRIRGPGEFLGTRQHGRLPDLRLADLVRDARLVSVARRAARDTVRRDPGLRRDPHLRAAVETRWGERLALADVG